MPLNSLDLGIQNTEEIDDFAAAEAFLAGTDPSSLQKVDSTKQQVILDKKEPAKTEEKAAEEGAINTEVIMSSLDEGEEEKEIKRGA